MPAPDTSSPQRAGSNAARTRWPWIATVLIASAGCSGTCPVDTSDDDIGDTDQDTDSDDGVGSRVRVVVADFDGIHHFIDVRNDFTWRAVADGPDGWCSRSGPHTWGESTTTTGVAQVHYALEPQGNPSKRTRFEVVADGTFRLFAGNLDEDCPVLAETALDGGECKGCAPSVGWDVPLCDQVQVYASCF